MNNSCFHQRARWYLPRWCSVWNVLVKYYAYCFSGLIWFFHVCIHHLDLVFHYVFNQMSLPSTKFELFSNILIFVESSRWSHCSSSKGALPSSFGCNTELKCLQSINPFLIRLDFFLYLLRLLIFTCFPFLFSLSIFLQTQVVKEPKIFNSFRERLHHLQVNLFSHVIFWLSRHCIMGAHVVPENRRWTSLLW